MKKARVPSGPILSTADIMAEQQYQQRGMFQQAAAPGSTQQVGAACCWGVRSQSCPGSGYGCCTTMTTDAQSELLPGSCRAPGCAVTASHASSAACGELLCACALLRR